jgi:hypothetical protein
MNKSKIFFEKIGILNDKDFDVLSQYANVTINLPLNNGGIVNVIINFHKILPIEIFKKIYCASSKLNNQIKIEFKSRIGDFEISSLVNYIKFFIEINNIKKLCIDNLLKRQAIDITESGLLIFHYFNKVEINELKEIETDLLNFLKKIAFAITGIDYQMDQERQGLEIHKQKQLDKILITTDHSPRVIALKKAAEQNFIKEKTVDSIVKLQIEERNAIIGGEIFKIEQIRPRNKQLLIYKFSITDYEGAIVITAFAQNDSQRWGSRFLPQYYLDSFTKGD